jgi:hypothetical protein
VWGVVLLLYYGGSMTRHKLSQAELRAMGVSSGLMTHRTGPDGCSRLEHLTSEGSGGKLRRTAISTLCMKEEEIKALSDEHYRQVHELESGEYDG